MTVIESTVEVNKPVSEVYTFLSNMNNHQQLMPENIYNWESTEDDARFTIQNMAKLAIKISNRVENEEITANILKEAKNMFPNILESHTHTLVQVLSNFLRSKYKLVSDFGKCSFG